ncbi:TPA_asm: hypothetical protein [Microviridae sp.]|nr:TPA_asm: hypothetical protein [Microviridae sp.]
MGDLVEESEDDRSRDGGEEEAQTGNEDTGADDGELTVDDALKKIATLLDTDKGESDGNISTSAEDVGPGEAFGDGTSGVGGEERRPVGGYSKGPSWK